MKVLVKIVSFLFVFLTISCSRYDSVLYIDTYWDALYGHTLDGPLGQYLDDNHIKIVLTGDEPLDSGELKKKERVYFTPGVNTGENSVSDQNILDPGHSHWQQGWEDLMKSLEEEEEENILFLYDPAFLEENFGIAGDSIFKGDYRPVYSAGRRHWKRDDVSEILNEHPGADTYYLYMDNVLQIMTLLKDQEAEIHVIGLPFIYENFRSSVYSLLPDWQSLLADAENRGHNSSAKEVLLGPLALKNRKRSYLFMNLVEKIKNR